EQRIELMTAVGRVERLARKTVAIYGRAEDQGAQVTRTGRPVRLERVVAVPQAEIGFDAQCVVVLFPPGTEETHPLPRAERAAHLYATATVVIAEGFARAKRGKARLQRGGLPHVVGGREIVHLGAEVDFPRGEERPFEPEGIADTFRGDPPRKMARDVGVIEIPVVENSGAEPE